MLLGMWDRDVARDMGPCGETLLCLHTITQIADYHISR